MEDLPDHISEPSIRTAVGGGGHTFLLTAQGRLFGAGWNTSGQVRTQGEDGRMIQWHENSNMTTNSHLKDIKQPL